MAQATSQHGAAFSIEPIYSNASLQQGLDIGFQILGLGGGREPIDHLAVAVDQELGEVPLDGLAAEHALGATLQPAIQWMRRIAIHVDFLEHGEADAIVLLAEAA